MQTNARLASVLCLSAAAIAAIPGVAAAQTPPSAAARQEAGRHFRSGVQSYERGDYSAALAEFQSAYRIAPHHSVRVNIANCFMHLGRPIDALNHFESFIAEATTAGGIPPQQRREVESQISELRGQIAEVSVRIDPASVRDPIITVDGQTANASGVVRMMPGRHAIEVTADGFAPGRQDFTASAGQRADLTITLRPPAAVTTATSTTTVGTTATGTVGATATSSTTSTTAATSTTATTSVGANSQPIATNTTDTTSTATSSGPSTSTATSTSDATGSQTTVGAGNEVIAPVDRPRGLPLPVFIGAAAGTGALAITWGVFGGLAMGANGEFDTIARRIESGNAQPNDVQRAEDAARRARTFALVSDVMMGVTIAGAVATTVIAINTRWSNPRANTVALVPTVNAGGAGLAIGGSL
ncbi:MAG: hypothetical protein U0269_02220 [Polyangiales bacterium]